MDTVTSTILYLLLFLIFGQFFKWVYNHLSLRKRMSSMPGPYTLPFIGIAWQIRNISTDDLYEHFMKLSFQFKNGLFVSWLGTSPIVILRKPHLFEVVMRSRTLISKGNLYYFLSYWLKNGLLTSTGDVWHQNRRLITPAFHFNILEEFTDVIAEKVDLMNNYLKKQVGDSPGKTLNIFPIAIKFTLETTLKTVMGVDLDEEKHSAKNEYVTALHTFADLTIYRTMHLPYRWDFIFYRTKKGKKYLKALKTLHAFTIGVINKKRKARESQISHSDKTADIDTNIGTHKKSKAFLDLLMDLSEADENPWTMEQLREQVDTFMFAAHDTTGIALSYVLFCLGNVPEIQKNVQKEIIEVFGSESDEPVTKEKLAQLKLLERVIKESLRLFPSAPVINRMLEHDIELDGYTIPKGMVVGMQILNMHRDPDVWEDPLKFDPDRFLPENSHGRHPYAYVPFSAGPRNCIGQKFAMLVLKIALVGILRKWTVSSDVKIKDAKLSAMIVLTPPNETINLYFKPV